MLELWAQTLPPKNQNLVSDSRGSKFSGICSFVIVGDFLTNSEMR